jgi:hypothetical protein
VARVQEQQREAAAVALMGLASAAGRAKDLLLLVKLLLRIGQPRPFSQQDDAHEGDGAYVVDGGAPEMEEEDVKGQNQHNENSQAAAVHMTSARARAKMLR